MIVLAEQCGYYSPFKYKGPYDYSLLFSRLEPHSRFFRQKKKEVPCYTLHKDEEFLLFETSYFVGTHWLIENELAVYVEPKQNEETKQINYLAMLVEALSEPENLDHLEHLFEIDFTKPAITIDQSQDLLSPLLIIQYLHLLKKIAQKGLRKSYYRVTQNLNSRMKGKILVNTTIKHNWSKNKMLHTYCEYEEFGINTLENKVLKKALLFTQQAVENIKGIDAEPLLGLCHYIQSSFQSVDTDVEVEQLKSIKPNPLYREYEQALKLAKLILKRYGYTISSIHSTKVETPPFWIDMSKLFELYVYKKLRELFPVPDEIKYHEKVHYQEPDFILNSSNTDIRMVIDAKYKPKYKDSNIDKDDARQVSGYARLKKMYSKLGLEQSKEIIDCLIIYSDQDVSETLTIENLKKYEDPNYAYFFKIGIKLPEFEI